VLLLLQERASKMAGMVAAFCNQMGWTDMELLVTKFQGRCSNQP
jgi:DNA polymerase theta